MRLARSAFLAVVLAALVGAVSLLGSPAQAAPAAPAVAAADGTLTSDVTGNFTDAQGGQGTFTGTFTPHKFVQSGNSAVAQGTLEGTLKDSTGADVGTVNQAADLTLVSAAATPSAAKGAAVAATCSILDLVLAPLDLNLLGLTVHLNQVVLHIAAVSGANALLGNLLCAITGLLDGGNLAALITALNQILALLGLLS